MTVLNEFASSSNGDKWFLGKDDETGVLLVLHRGNAPSGGHETRSSVDAFLDRQPLGPEHNALIAFLDNTDGDPDVGDDGQTPSLRLAQEYLRLGGRRRAKVDDNIVATRQWDDEPAMASAFCEENIERLEEKKRREVEIHLPSISDT